VFTASAAVSLAFPAGAAALNFKLTTATAEEHPVNVAVGDVNSDGKPDLATANIGSGDVTVLLGDGSGGFVAAPGSPFAAGDNPRSVAIGYLNKDGKLDLAVANSGSSSVTVLLGNGFGGFVPAAGSPFAVGPGSFLIPRSVAIRDLNDDGNRDLAVAVYGANNVSVLRGDGSGGFVPEPRSPFPVGKNPNSVAVGDLNKDGRPDLATANSGSDDVTVLLRNGSGGFVAAPQSPLRVGNYPASVAIGNLNNDGKPDLAVASFRAHNVSVLLGNGSGRFVRPSGGGRFAVGYAPYSVAMGDLNSDRKPDLAVPDADGRNVWVLLGNGSGGFVAAAGSPFTVDPRWGPYSVAIADFNSDGKPDITTANWYANNVAVLLNTSQPKAFPTPARLPFGSRQVGTQSVPRSVVIANTGQARLHISKVKIGGRNLEDFTIAGEDCTGRAILVGRRCTVYLRFAPTALGARAAALGFFSDDPRSPLAIQLSGTGTAP
jgi:hypothetical protein